MKPLLALILLCAAFDAWGQPMIHCLERGEEVPCNKVILPKCDPWHEIFCQTQPTAQELRDAAILRELRAMRNDVRRLESLLKAERNSGHQ